MRYYPVLLDLHQKSCLVVGGGAVAERKVRSLLKAGASVGVVSPQLTAGLGRLARAQHIRYYRCRYQARFLRGCWLVIVATSDRDVNARVVRDASGLLINVVDVPDESNFIVPSVISRNGLLMAISTEGRAPCLSKKIRQDLQRQFLPRYEPVLANIERARRTLKKTGCPVSRRSVFLRGLVNSPDAGCRWPKVEALVDAFALKSAGRRSAKKRK